jgi:DNA polymerase III delta prime subunit
MMSDMHHAQLLFAHDILSIDLAAIHFGTDTQDTVFEKFGVEEAQQLVRSAHVRPTDTALLVCIVRAQFITLEAQNALLKVFEEPPASTKFLLIVPKDFVVLPTLLSRCEIIKHEQVANKNGPFTEFLGASYAERLAKIDKAQKNKDTTWQRSMKQGLVGYLETNTEHLKELEYAARLLLTRGASNKFLLEHAALTIPPRSKG